MNYYYISEDETIIGPLTITEVAKAKVSLKSKFCMVGANEWQNIVEFPDTSVLRKLIPPPALPEAQKQIPLENRETIDNSSSSESECDTTLNFILEKRTNKEIFRHTFLSSLIVFFLSSILLYIFSIYNQTMVEDRLLISLFMGIIMMLSYLFKDLEKQKRALKIDDCLRTISIDYTEFLFFKRNKLFSFDKLYITIKSKLIPKTLDQAEPNSIIFFDNRHKELFTLYKDSKSYSNDTFNQIVQKIDALTNYLINKKNRAFN